MIMTWMMTGGTPWYPQLPKLRKLPHDVNHNEKNTQNGFMFFHDPSQKNMLGRKKDLTPPKSKDGQVNVISKFYNVIKLYRYIIVPNPELGVLKALGWFVKWNSHPSKKMAVSNR